jgi:hypothetical protein
VVAVGGILDYMDFVERLLNRDTVRHNITLRVNTEDRDEDTSQKTEEFEAQIHE